MTDQPTRALSLWSPWAWAILHCGKDIENRSWSPPQSMVGQRFWIHVSLRGKSPAQMREDADPMLQLAREHAPNSPAVTLNDLIAMRGHIVGSVKLAGASQKSHSPWFFGPVGFRILDARPCVPVPCKGALGFFKVPHDVLRKLTEQR
jgi:hypothetical protein